MVLTICMSGKNAVGDSYKNIINEMPNKKKIICLIPEGYEKEEFSDEFAKIILDNISHSKFRLIKSILFANKLRKIVKEKSINKVFIYFDNHWFNIILTFFLLNLKVKIYTWIHDPELHLGSNKKDRIIRFLNRKVFFPRVEKFIVSYNNAVKEIADSMSIQNSKIDVIYLPRMIEMEFPDIREKDFDIEYDFIFFGRIEEYKGIELLVEVIKKFTDVKLLILGKGNFSGKVKEKIKCYKNIVFINEYISNRELAIYIKKSRWVVLPYKSATGSQTVQISNYYNRPVIATKVGCFAEYVKNGINGILIEKYNCFMLEEAIFFAMRKNLIEFDVSMKKWLVDNFSIMKTVISLSEKMEIDFIDKEN